MKRLYVEMYEYKEDLKGGRLPSLDEGVRRDRYGPGGDSPL